jgi:hypothetical protein
MEIDVLILLVLVRGFALSTRIVMSVLGLLVWSSREAGAFELDINLFGSQRGHQSLVTLWLHKEPFWGCLTGNREIQDLQDKGTFENGPL